MAAHSQDINRERVRNIGLVCVRVCVCVCMCVLCSPPKPHTVRKCSNWNSELRVARGSCRRAPRIDMKNLSPAGPKQNVMALTIKSANVSCGHLSMSLETLICEILACEIIAKNTLTMPMIYAKPEYSHVSRLWRLAGKLTSRGSEIWILRSAHAATVLTEMGKIHAMESKTTVPRTCMRNMQIQDYTHTILRRTLHT